MSKRVIDAAEVARAHESLGLTTEIADQGVYERTVQRFQERNIALPTFAELAGSLPASSGILNPSAGIGAPVSSCGRCHSCAEEEKSVIQSKVQVELTLRRWPELVVLSFIEVVRFED